jgi:hypothetical protein
MQFIYSIFYFYAMHPVVYIDLMHLCPHLPQFKQVTLGDALQTETNPVQKKATTAQYNPKYTEYPYSQKSAHLNIVT